MALVAAAQFLLARHASLWLHELAHAAAALLAGAKVTAVRVPLVGGNSHTSTAGVGRAEAFVRHAGWICSVYVAFFAARTLTLLTKALTNLANLVEFGKKEPYLEQFNEGFIRPNVPFMTALTTALSRERGSAGDDEGRLALPPCDLRFRLAQLLVFLKRKPDAVMDAARKGGFDAAAQAAYDAATAIEDYRGSTAPELEVSAAPQRALHCQ